jgi:membrane associated rhomboid family serine protease
MSTQHPFRFSTGVIGYPIAFVLLIWIVFWVEVRFGYRLNTLGVFPRTISGLKGVIFSPFIHSSLEHLYHNSTPLLVLSTALFYFYRSIAWKVILCGILFSGLFTWGIGSSGYHIGASGLIYVLMSFMLFKGLISKNFRLIALSFIVIFLYGGMLWYVFPIKENMSWEGHLSGLVVGLIFALIFRTTIAKPPKYVWEHEHYDESEDPFLQQFDADGNFIEHLENDEHSTDNSIEVRYNYKEKDV